MFGATRVLTPMARANTKHANALAESLMKEKISTRNLFIFFQHYKKSNRKTREKMVKQPQLFIKALEASKQDNLSKQLKAGPEGQWLTDVKMISHIIRRLIKQTPSVIYTGQSNLDKRCLLTAFKKTKDLFCHWTKKSEGLTMISEDKRQTVISLHQAGCPIRQIGRLLNISRNAVRRIVRGQANSAVVKASRYQPIMPLVGQYFKFCKGNVVRIKEILHDQYGHDIPYSTLTRLVRELGLRDDKKKQRAGS